MTRVSIIAEDDIIVVDKKTMTVDCSVLRDKRISAIQWYHDRGEVEFDRHHKANEVIHSLDQFQSLVTAAKAIKPPKPPTPKEHDEAHNRLLLDYPDWRKLWEERDAEIKRLLDRNLLTADEIAALPAPEPPAETETTSKSEPPEPK